jgi:hypothetical protein
VRLGAISGLAASSPKTIVLNVALFTSRPDRSAVIVAAAGASVVYTPGFNAGKFFGWLAEFSPPGIRRCPPCQAVLARPRSHSQVIAAHPPPGALFVGIPAAAGDGRLGGFSTPQ